MWDHEEAVAKGVALLDAQMPGWDQNINLGTLEMESCTQCIVGQIFIATGVTVGKTYTDSQVFIEGINLLGLSYGTDDEIDEQYGFCLYDDDTDEDYDCDSVAFVQPQDWIDLGNTWKDAILARRSMS